MLGIEATREQLGEVVGDALLLCVPKSGKGTGREIRRADPGGWAGHMTREEIIEMHGILGSKLDELGYLRPGDIPAKRHAA